MAEVKNYFNLVRLYCFRIIENPSKENIDIFNDLINVMDSQVLQQLQEYLLFEISHTLHIKFKTVHNVVAPDYLIDYVSCIQTILSKTELKSWELFNKVVSNVAIILIKSNSGEALVSEELKLSVVNCINEAIKRSTEGVLQKFYGDDVLHILGCLIYNLQQLFENEKYRKLILNALDCLRIFINKFYESSLRYTLADPLATFVPGISLALVKLATNGAVNGIAVVTEAIQIWTDLLVGVFDDELLRKSVVVSTDKGDTSSKNLLKIPIKDRDWLKMASERLAILMPKVAAFESHQNWKVRLAVAKWAHTLLSRCKRSLDDSVSHWLSSLISLSVDDFPSVKNFCLESLSEFSSQLQQEDESLVDMINDYLLSLTIELPKIVKQSDDSRKLAAVNQLYGYIHVLGSRINDFLNSVVHLEKLSFAFIHLLELDVRNVHLVTEINHNKLPDEVPFCKSFRQFKNFDNENIYQRSVQIWRLLGKYGDLQLLVDHMLDRFHQSFTYRKQSALILNEIILGRIGCENLNQQFSTIQWVVDEYLEPNIWNLRITKTNDDLGEHFTDDNSSSMQLATYPGYRVQSELPLSLNDNVMLICICLEGIGACSQATGIIFKSRLRLVLYEVLEKCGCDNALISDTAMNCLNDISRSCEYENIADLIMDNADYLLNSITLKLIHQALDPKVPKVLHVVLMHGRKEVITIVVDLIEEMLKCIDDLTGSRLVPYVRVLDTFCQIVIRWFSKEEMANSPNCAIEMDEENVLHYILNFHNEKLLSEKLDDAEDLSEHLSEMDFKNQDDITEDKNDEPESSAVPPYITLTAKVLEKCGHLLPSSDPFVIYWIFNVINNAAQALKGQNDILFPSVHKIWPSLSKRFLIENYIVLKSAFKAVCTLVEVCEDFVRSRVMKEVWPRLIEFLNNKSKKKIREELYLPTYKLLEEVLLGLGSVSKHLKLNELELDNLASCVIEFVKQFQPTTIQLVACSLLEDLAMINSDVIWLKLHDVIMFEYTDLNDSFNKENLKNLLVKVENNYGENN